MRFVRKIPQLFWVAIHMMLQGVAFSAFFGIQYYWDALFVVVSLEVLLLLAYTADIIVKRRIRNTIIEDPSDVKFSFEEFEGEIENSK